MEKIFAEAGLDRSLPHIGVIMEKRDTFDYPRYSLPNGFEFSLFRQGFERQWAELQLEAGLADTLEDAESVFRHEFLYGKSIDWTNRDKEAVLPENTEECPCFNEMCRRMVFVVDGSGNLAGTGALWKGDIFGTERQRLHWIAVKPEHQGKGIAKAIVARLLDTYNRLGYSKYVYLTSQTWSYKALGIYMNFGFTPYMGEKPEKWKSVNLTSGNFEPWDYREKNTEAWCIIREKLEQYKNK